MGTLMKTPRLADLLPPLFAGALIPVYMQTVTGWWLNSGRGVAYTGGALLTLLALFVLIDGALADQRQ